MLTPRIGVVIAAAALFLQGCTGGTDENALPEAVDFNFHIRPMPSPLNRIANEKPVGEVLCVR